MATEILGPQIDIHCGGEDNIFPHHEAEIAQSECVTGKAFVKLWMHCKHLQVDGRKMAKKRRQLLHATRSGRSRVERAGGALCSLVGKIPRTAEFHHRRPRSGPQSIARYDEWSRRLGESASSTPEPLPEGLDPEKFGAALDEDLNISAALGALFDLIRDSNRLLAAGTFTPGQARTLLNWREKIESVLALSAEDEGIPEAIKALLDRRAQVRAEKNWALSDQLRDDLLAQGWQVKDTKDGQKLTRRI